MSPHQFCRPRAGRLTSYVAVLVRLRWQGEHGSPLLGAVFIYAPLMHVAATAVHGAVRRNAVTTTWRPCCY